MTEPNKKQQTSPTQRPRKTRKPYQAAHINQAPTAISAYTDEKLRDSFRGMRGIILELMEDKEMTAAEIRLQLRRKTGIDSPESTIFGQLHALFGVGMVTDRGTEDRECQVSGRNKKTWRLTTPEERIEHVQMRKAS